MKNREDTGTDYTALPTASALEASMLAGTILSGSVLYCLKRGFLDVALKEARHLRAVPPPAGGVSPPFFLQFEQVGAPADLHLASVALRTALSACHLPGRHSLVFVLSSDTLRCRVFMGIRSHDEDQHPACEFAENLGRLLCSSWPGTQVRLCSEESDGFRDGIATPLKSLKHAMAVTGVPGLQDGHMGSIGQSLDRFIAAMRGERYAYVVVADPVADFELDSILFGCREMAAQVHSVGKMNLSESLSQSWNEQLTRGASATSTESQSDSHKTSYGQELLQDVAVVAGTITPLFPPAALVAMLAGTTSFLLPDSIREGSGRTFATSQAVSESVSQTYGKSETSGISSGREVINAHAQATEDLIHIYIKHLEDHRASGCWNVGAYLLADSKPAVRRAAQCLRSILAGGNAACEPIRFHDLSDCWTNAAGPAARSFRRPPVVLCDPRSTNLKRVMHPLGRAHSEMSTILSGEELALLINIPQREVPGISVVPSALFSLNPGSRDPRSLLLGHAIEGGVFDAADTAQRVEYRISDDSLAKHILVTGITGSGKSTTCRRLLGESFNRGIPFLIIEPAKEEYVEWVMELNDRLPEDSQRRFSVFIPGRSDWRGCALKDQLTLNPFDLVWLEDELPPHVSTHIDRLKSVLSSAFSMQEILPVILEDLVYHVYRVPGRDWLGKQRLRQDSYRPTLTQMLNHLERLVKRKGYDSRITTNITAALRTRIQSLRNGWKRTLFDAPRSTPWNVLFDRNSIINLSYLGDDAEKAFAMSVILMFLYEYRQAQAEAARWRNESILPVRHVALIEEAHRILRRPGATSEFSANPQAKSAELFSNMFSEIRAYGQGLVVVDQAPSRLIADAIKNTNLKIVHRLLAKDDREEMAGCMGLNADQSRLLNRLKPGEAIVFGDLDSGASLVQCLS